MSSELVSSTPQLTTDPLLFPQPLKQQLQCRYQEVITGHNVHEEVTGSLLEVIMQSSNECFVEVRALRET